MNKFKIGDRVKVIEPECDFGDYDAGDEAVIVSVQGPSEDELIVKWAARRFADQAREDDRVRMVFSREVELVP